MLKKKVEVSREAHATSKKDFALIPNWVQLIIVCIIAFLFYANTLQNGFVLDDAVVLQHNKLVLQGTSAIPEIFSTPYRFGYGNSANNLYRPLSMAIFAVVNQFAGLNATIYHLLNILVFVACVFVFFLLLKKMLEDTNFPVAFVATLFFAAHPIHTEVVANIKSLDELLCFFFSFLCLHQFLKYSETNKLVHLIIGILFFFLGLLAKETAIAFVVLLPLIFFFYRNENKNASASITLFTIMTVCAFLYLRYSVLNAHHIDLFAKAPMIDNELAAPNLPADTRIATAIYILGYYVLLLFIPHPLICDYSYQAIPYVSFMNGWVMLSLVIYLLLAVWVVWNLLKKEPLLIAALLFLVPIFLFSNLFFLIGSAMGERFLFFSSAGFCLFLALILQKIIARRASEIVDLKSPKLLATIIPLLALYGFLTVCRNSDWKDNLTLCKTDVAKSPNSARLNFYFGLELGKEAQAERNEWAQKEILGQSIDYLRKAVMLLPTYGDAQAALGTSYGYLSKLDSAEAHLKIAYDIFPADEKNTGNLALVYYINKKYLESIKMSEQVIKLNPTVVSAYMSMASCYLNLNQAGLAVQIAHRAMQAVPREAQPYLFLSKYYNSIGRQDSAGYYMGMARKLGGR